MPSLLQESGLDKPIHAVVYGAIAFLLILSMKRMLSTHSAALVMFGLSGICILDEVTQPLVNRQASIMDLVADVVGILAVLLFFVFADRRLRKIKTESFYRLCFVAASAFIAGVMVVPVTSITVTRLRGPALFQQRQAARYFFLWTMQKLFESEDYSEKGSIKEDAMGALKEYASRFGDKCVFELFSDPYSLGWQKAGYFGGSVFFPSGEMFSAEIVQVGDRFVIEKFERLDWESLWMENRTDIERYYRLGYSPVFYEP